MKKNTQIIKNLIFLLMISIFGQINIFAQQDLKPEPECISEATVALKNGAILLWAKDFVLRSTSRTTLESDLRYTFSDTNPNVDDTYDASQKSSIKEFSSTQDTTIEADVYIWDDFDNYDFCTIKLRLIVDGSNDGWVNGKIINLNNFNLINYENIDIHLINQFNENDILIKDLSYYHDFAFNDIETGTYNIKAEIEDDLFLNGVTTLDMVLIQKHLLHLDELDTAKKRFAADVNQDNIINTLDLIMIRNMVLGKTVFIPQSYRFLNSSQLNGSVPLDSINGDIIISVNGDQKTFDLYTIKLGDINGSAFNAFEDNLTMEELDITEEELASMFDFSTSDRKVESVTPRTTNPTVFDVPKLIVDSGQNICVPVTITNYNTVAGFQFPISWDKNVLSYTNFNRIASDFGLLHSNPQNGELIVLATLYNKQPANNEILFEVCFDVIGENGDFTDLNFDSNLNVESGVFNDSVGIPYTLIPGLITVGQNCLDYINVNLDPTGKATILAKDLYYGELDSDIITIDGNESILLTCDDIGVDTITLLITHDNGFSNCDVIIEVKDIIPPYVVVNTELDITLDDNLYLDLTSDMFEVNSHDNCGEITFSISPTFIDCTSDNPTEVEFTASDKSGNSYHTTSYVNITYPQTTSTVVCKDIVNVVLEPNFGAEVTPEMVLLGGPYGCYINYEIRVFDSLPDNFNSQGMVGNPIQEAGLYTYGLVDENGNNCWGQVEVLDLDSTIAKFILPEVAVEQGTEVCISMAVENFNDISEFTFPLSWNKEVLKFKSFKNIDNSPFQNIIYTISEHDNEALVLGTSASEITLADNTILFDICFDAIGEINTFSDILFSSPTSFVQPTVFKNGEISPHFLKKGKVTIGKLSDFCNAYKQISLNAQGQAKLDAKSFNNNGSLNDYYLVNGEQSIIFNCDDLGELEVIVTKTDIDSNIETCITTVIVEDKLPPFIIAKSNIILTPENNGDKLVLTQDMVVEYVIDNCYYSVKIEPAELNCTSQETTEITISVADESGNSSSAKTHVNFICPSLCADNMIVSLDANDGTGVINIFSYNSNIGDVILINGELDFKYYCDDLGKNIVNLTVKQFNGDTIQCNALVTVIDEAPPVAICEEHLEVTLNSDLKYEISTKQINNGSYDNCTDNLVMSMGLMGGVIDFDSLLTLGCYSDSLTNVILKVADESGNYNTCITQVFIKQPVINTIVCHNQILVSLLPGQEKEIVPDMVLAGEQKCNNYYNLNLFDNINDTIPQSDNIVDTSDIGTIVANVTDFQTNNSCWSTIEIRLQKIDTISFNLPEVRVTENEEVCISMTVENFDRITEFQFPLSWNKDIIKFKRIELPDNSRLKDINFSVSLDNSEAFVNWDTSYYFGVTVPDGTSIFDLCFTGIGDIGSSSNIDFLSPSGFVQTVVKRKQKDVPHKLNKGKITIQQKPGGCIIDTIDVYLQEYICNKTVSAEEFYIKEPGDTILINGESEVTFEGVGIREVTVTIIHSNGEIQECVTIVNVIDNTPPIAVCNQHINITLPNNLTTTLDPEMFDAGSFDNCSSISFSVSPSFINCNSETPDTVTLIAKDEYGNLGWCWSVVTINYADHPGNSMACNDNVSISVFPVIEVEVTADMILDGDMTCPNYYDLLLFDNTGSTIPQDDNIVDISDVGNTYVCKVIDPKTNNHCWSNIIIEEIESPSACAFRMGGEPIADVKMLDGYITNETGCISLENIPSGTEIVPSKQDSWLTGVDVMDLILMKKHILGVDTNLTPYQKIAADININEYISTLDIVILQKIILGLSDGFENNNPWVFIDAAYQFPSTDNPYDSPVNFPKSINYTNPNTKYDFIGVKLGDLNNDLGKDYSKTKLVIKDVTLNMGESYEVSFFSTVDYNLEGIQLGLDYDSTKIKVTSVSSNVLEGTFLDNIENSKIKLLYMATVNEDNNIFKDTKLFNIKLEALANTVLSKSISLEEEKTNMLVSNDNPYDIEIEWQDKIDVGTINFNNNIEINLYPQPASDFVNVKIKNIDYNSINFTITNLVGQKVVKDKLVGKTIDISNLESGLYLIHFYNNEGQIVVKKLIVNK